MPLDTLVNLKIKVARYSGRDYGATQAIAAASYHLEFDGLIVPSARFACWNLVLFTDHIATNPDSRIEAFDSEAVDWVSWRAGQNIKE